MAGLLIDVLRSYVREKKFSVHDFVVMPNHVHILLTVPGEVTIEKAMQLIKGIFFPSCQRIGFSRRDLATRIL